MIGGRLAIAGEFRVGGSDQSGAQYNAVGTATLANATMTVGALTIARGNYLDNSVSGTLTLNSGSTLVSTNDVVVQFAGSGLGKLALNGGNLVVGPTVGKWLMVGYWDSGAGQLDITSGNLFLENGSSLKMCRGSNSTGSNVVNQIGGYVTFFSDAGVSVGGSGKLDLNHGGGPNSVSTYNLNGGTLTVPQIISSSSSGTHRFNFNGGTLKAAAPGTSFFASGAATIANVRNLGAIIDTTNFNVTIGQALVHSTVAGDSPSDGGLTKHGTGTLTLTGANTYTGPTTINGGTLALGSGGSIGSSSSINLSPGTAFNVSTVNYALGAAQTLRGSGSVIGTATINGTLAPGPSLGTLTFSTPPILNGLMVLELNRTNSPNSDRLVINSGTLNYGGVLTVTNTGPALQSGDSFHLFSANPLSGAFAATNLPALGPGLGWSFNPLSGVLSVTQTVATNPPNVSCAISNGSLTLSWPDDHIGWRLLAQTNNLATGISSAAGDWAEVPGSGTTNRLDIPTNPGMPAGFYRLVFP